MHRMMELFAIMDYIKMALEHKDYAYLNSEPFETIYISWSGNEEIAGLDELLTSGKYREALERIDQFRRTHQELYRIYLAIKRDYQMMSFAFSTEDILLKIKDKYGVPDGEELLTLLRIQESFLEEHEYS